jgi:hypothetical protein
LEVAVLPSSVRITAIIVILKRIQYPVTPEFAVIINTLRGLVPPPSTLPYHVSAVVITSTSSSSKSRSRTNFKTRQAVTEE